MLRKMESIILGLSLSNFVLLFQFHRPHYLKFKTQKNNGDYQNNIYKVDFTFWKKYTHI